MDTLFVRAERIPADRNGDAALPIAPDLVVEVVSPSDTASGLRKTLRDSRAAGVRLAWVVCPEVRSASIHRVDRTVEEGSSGEDLDGEDVLPGFRCAVDAIFPEPPGSPRSGD